MSGANETVILIPTYNEVRNIGLTIDKVFAIDERWHVLVLDDDSPDGTGDIVREKMKQYPHLQLVRRTQNKGFAQSYIDGFRRVLDSGVYASVITMDADFSHDPKEIPAMIAALSAGHDLVVGSRYARRRVFPEISLWRRVLSRFANSYVKTILQLPIADCTSGFIAMKSSLLPRLNFDDIRTEGYGFLFEIKYQAHRLGSALAEHPVEWPTRHQGQSKMNLRRIMESACLPWQIRFSRRRRSREIPARAQ